MFTSHIFVILGLRAMYFLLADMAERLHLLNYGLALIVTFIGVKMLLIDFFEIPVFVAPGAVVALITASIAASLAWRPKPGA